MTQAIAIAKFGLQRTARANFFTKWQTSLPELTGKALGSRSAIASFKVKIVNDGENLKGFPRKVTTCIVKH